MRYFAIAAAVTLLVLALIPALSAEEAPATPGEP